MPIVQVSKMKRVFGFPPTHEVMDFAMTSVVPTYLRVPTDAKSIMKKVRVHQSTRRSTNSLARSFWRRRLIPAEIRAVPIRRAFFCNPKAFSIDA
jgi:hypothetical protein